MGTKTEFPSHTKIAAGTTIFDTAMLLPLLTQELGFQVNQKYSISERLLEAVPTLCEDRLV